MTSNEFIAELEKLLKDIPLEERDEALQYYREYLEDAGENIAHVLAELGSPASVAKSIKQNLYNREEKGGVYTETGYFDSTERPGRQELVKPELEKVEEKQEKKQTEQTVEPEWSKQTERTEKQADWSRQTNESQQSHKSSYQHSSGGGYDTSGMYEKKSSMSGGMKALLIILAIIFAIPILGLVIGAVGTVIGVVIGAFGLFLGYLLVTACLLISGIILIGVGIVNLFSTFAASALLCGIGSIILGIGILFFIGAVFLCNTVIPKMIKGILYLCRLPFRKGRTA